MKKNIQAVIFDLGGVILNIDYQLTKKAFEKLQVKDFDELYSQARASQLFEKLERGNISNEDFYVELNNCTGLALSPGEIVTAWNAMLLDYRKDTLKFIEQLKQSVPIYLFSNTNFIHMDSFMKRFEKISPGKHLNEYFTKAYYSCEIGKRKPDPESYRYLLNDIQLMPENILFIDDSKQNVESASLVGLNSIHLKTGMTVESLPIWQNQ